MTATTDTKIIAGEVLRRDKYGETARCGCGEKYRRAKGAAYEGCLECQTAQRLAAAGFTHDDPALTRIRDHNTQATHWNLPSHVRYAAENADRSDRAAAVQGVITR